MNAVIRESDLGIVCDSRTCTGIATYIVTLRLNEGPLTRLYCPDCTRAVIEGVATVLARNDSDESIHDYVEFELLMHGGRVDA